MSAGESVNGIENVGSDMRMSTHLLWQTVTATLSGRIPRRAFDNWFSRTALMSVDDDRATISAPNAFTASTLEARYSSQVERALADVIGRQVEVAFVVGNGSDPADTGPTVPLRSKTGGEGGSSAGRRSRPSRPAPDESALQNRQLQLDTASERGLQSRLVYDTYVVGSSNRLAHAASLAVAENPGRQFNPLFVHGGVGLGKTHLLHAIGHRALELNPGLTIMYVTSETFTNDVINAIRSQRMEEFRSRYRLIDILMVDDIQFIAGKESTQEEFFHTFNALYQNGKQIVVSSDKPPRAIAALEERMRSRFAGGMVADVQSPDYEMRTLILRQKAEELGVHLADDVVEYVAHKDQTNIRELEGALNRILMMAQLYKRPLNLQVAMEALTDSGSNRKRPSTSPDDVVNAVVQYFGINQRDLYGRQRKREIVMPRQIAMYVMREETSSSLVDIGRALGNRDHSTVLHGIEKIEKALQVDTRLRSQIIAIRESLLTDAR